MTTKASSTERFCRSLWGPALSSPVPPAPPPCKPQGPRTSLDVARSGRFAAARRSLVVFLDAEVWVAAWVGADPLVLLRVTPLPSSPYLCFPCEVWGFSKQTGGDKHMLWTALCWVVSEVQQSRSLSGCGYTSHSEVDGRTGALLLPHW